MDLVFFGIQGSGKGTQSQIIAKKYHLTLFETGAELRHLAAIDSPLGNKVKKITEAGHLVPNQTVMEILENFMKNIPTNQGVVFDGVPRKADQANSFAALMKNLQREFQGILIEISKEEALKRLTTRRICNNCKQVYPVTYDGTNCGQCSGTLMTRKDDNPASIIARLQAFESETLPVIQAYQAAGQLISIDGTQPIDKVNIDIVRAIDDYFK